MKVSKDDEKNLINFLLAVPNQSDAKKIFNMWSNVYDTSEFDADDIQYIIRMINLYKKINLNNEIRRAFLKL